MGSPENEPERFDDEKQHRVRLSAFELSATAVTNAEYKRFDRNHEPETFGGKLAETEVAIHPVVNVSWWEARLYCLWRGGRLPAEAEWEYACRAGTETPFSFGENVTSEQVNYDGNYPYAGGTRGKFREKTVPVGSLPANPWGILEVTSQASQASTSKRPRGIGAARGPSCERCREGAAGSAAVVGICICIGICVCFGARVCIGT